MTDTADKTAANAAPVQRPQAAAAALPLNPTTLDRPAFLMNYPFSYDTLVANNAWMQDLAADQRFVDAQVAQRQFLELYHFLAGEGLVYLLPTPANCTLQDLVFTANLGIVLEHVPGGRTAVLSNYMSECRRGETAVGQRFFEQMGYEVHVAPHRFEGEAELKHLHGNVYLGGYGLRSERAAFDWMEKRFDMQIVKVEETDPYLYHLDTMVFPITRERTLVCTELLSRAEVKAIERHTEVVDIAYEHCLSGLTNSVRLYNTIVNSSHIHQLKAGTEEYREELAKNRRLEDIATELGFEVSYFNLLEYHKGGALLSCMVMHLNRRSYDIRLL